ncbi:hypothetical protein [Primorskyibacter marinus]|uniref:hypothetical protein n=1 Tax=Primorskyibacter marinus TaxID=1977320 RepID=UPI000E308D55|nr:hypothetical protein [Primorskyibacter marinus]
MTANTKIATCCYCGTRAALELRGDVRHELACTSCGAPLHNLKMLRTDATAAVKGAQGKTMRRGKPVMAKTDRPSRKPKKARYKKRKGLAQRFVEEAFDVIEDLFD